MREHDDTEQPAEKLRQILKGIKFAMLTTYGPDGRLHSRPMTTQEAEFTDNLWFLAPMNGPMVQEIRYEPAVHLIYADTGSHRYVSLNGSARALQDGDKVRELWNPMVKAWFPAGPDDPNIALIRVTVEQAEYWDSPAKPAMLLNMVKSLATGKPPREGEHASFTLSEQD
jgi:general stress protein 26